MGYRTLRECVDDLDAAGMLLRIDEPIDARLEAAAIHRRVCAAGGPALFFSNVRGCRFPMVSNLFGTIGRARYLFRDRLEAVRRLVELKIAGVGALKHPGRYLRAPWTAWSMLPRRCRSGPVLANQTTIDQLPHLVSWPDDAGAFVTLPEVYTENAASPGLRGSNLGMYRVQLTGGRYQPNRQIGLHYQIHRGIGVHHAEALRRGKPFRVNIFVGGTPAMMLAAVMPLPEGMSELGFAGAIGGRRIAMIHRDGQLPIYAQADFCITGVVDPELRLPEGPFGDHLGYYSLAHDFPVLNVEHVYHRPGAIWPFTVVGRPPQEDTIFGELIHEITGPIIPTVIPGVSAVHAVDAAGVHPLLLAIGSERYAPHDPTRRPMELLTQAHAILGQGQLSLAKYLWIAAREDDPALDIHQVDTFLRHMLARVDWSRDLHFQTRTTIDTLDYSGDGLNEGSKVVIAAVGEIRRELPQEIPADLTLPDGFDDARVCLPGILAIGAPAWAAIAGNASERPGGGDRSADGALQRFVQSHDSHSAINRFPLVVLVDDAALTAASLANFLWVTFTRSNPAADIEGIDSFIEQKHWGCRGSLVIDARRKPHHAPPLVEDSEITRRVESLAAPGKPLYGVI